MKLIVRWITVIIVAMALLGCAGKKNVRQERFDPKVWLGNADKLIKDEEFEEARRLLFEVKNRDLTKKYAPIAQIKLGESYEAEEKPDEAIQEYRRFLSLYPDHPQAAYAQYKIAMVYFKQIDSPKKGAGGARKALHEFEKLLREYPRNPYREAAKLRIKKCRNLIAEYEMVVGRYYFKHEAYKAALNRFLEVVKGFSDTNEHPEAFYMVGLTYERMGKKDMARDYYTKLLSSYPDNPFTKKAEKNLKALSE
ncbi:MAG: outer membrane protein assembly factor BamD [Nitrospirae bacterium]|nr:MAG: outer membrane protein assembly factor BamD [Nitrospirota bacterium]